MNRGITIAALLLAMSTIGAPLALSVPHAVAQSVAAEAETATFAIENMTCALCPVTVRKALENVAGVQSVEIDFDAKTATVVFDPAAISIEGIAAASANAGYPAELFS